MRFLMIMYPGPHAEAGTFPDKKVFEDMGKYNEELVKAGVLLAAEGLQPSSKGARVRFAGGKPTVTDGPFTETKEVIGGFWMIRVKSRQEAIDWATRCPAPAGEMIELRQVYETEDFPPEVFSPELADQEKALRDKVEKTR